jgi:benzaldehyde dehydrogenase (NAD)
VRESVAQGAKLKAGGTYEKLFYRPTVLAEVKPDMRVYNEEVFGPVATVITFDSEDEAISIVNSSQYGFVAGVISSSVARALQVGEQLKVGMLHINDQTVDDEAVNTFGGFGASGNGGRHGGVANWDEYTQWQWVTIKDRPTAYPF